MAQEPDSLIRQAVRDRIATADQRGGDVLRLDPASTTRLAHWLLLVSFAIGLFCLLAVRVPQYARGPAVICLNRIDVPAKSNGIVRTVDVEFGQQVRTGDILVHFCDEQEAAELDHIEQAYELQLIKSLQDLHDQAARQKLAALRAQRTLAKALLERRCVKAPCDGTVGDVRVRPGEHFEQGDVLLALQHESSSDDRTDAPHLIAMLPAHHAPILKPGMSVRLELSGYRYTYAEAEIYKVEHEALGPAAIRRYLGQQFADTVTLQGPLVLVEARLEPGSQFEADGQRYDYQHGMQGVARVKVRTEPALCVLIPPLRTLLGSNNLSATATATMLTVATVALLLAVWFSRRPLLEIARRMRRAPIPFIPQVGSSDRTAVCLAMVLGYRGQKVTPDAIAARVETRPGSAIDLHEAAYCYGLVCRESRLGVGSAKVTLQDSGARHSRTEVDDLGMLRHVPRGSLIEVQSELVVFDHITARTVTILDPRRGRLHLPIDLFARIFSRRIWTFEPLAVGPQDRLDVTDDEATEGA